MGGSVSVQSVPAMLVVRHGSPEGLCTHQYHRDGVLEAARLGTAAGSASQHYRGRLIRHADVPRSCFQVHEFTREYS